MDGQGAGGFGFVVREVISGPRELAEVAPAQAVTLACLAGSDGEGQFWCGQLEQPVKHRIGQTVDTCRFAFCVADSDSPTCASAEFSPKWRTGFLIFVADARTVRLC